MKTRLLGYLARRVVFALLLIVLLASSALLLARLAPGDFATELVGTGMSKDAIERQRAVYGLDRPILEQYRAWLARAVRLDLGTSFRFGRPVSELVAERARNTGILALTALVLATLMGVPLGVLSGSRPDGVFAAIVRGTSLILLSVPPLLLSLALAFMAARTRWFPSGGMGGLAEGSPGIASAGGDLLWHLTLPALALALPIAATLERLQSQAMSETLSEPFILSAAGRGVPTGRVVWLHGLRVAIRPVLAVYGIVIGTLLSGSFAVEIVMAWPGLGQLMYDALLSRDIYLVAGCAAAGALFLTSATLATDVIQSALDPRLQLPV